MPCSAEAASRWGGAVAWAAVGALLLLPSLVVSGSAGAAAVLDWQPARWPGEVWRAWSAAWVHLSTRHLLANLAGGALVVALGIAARVPVRAAVAWALAWPLTHVGLLLTPPLAHYGGLSGVLHAGVAVAAVSLWRLGGRPRRLGAAIGLVLLAKLLIETPSHGALTQPDGWDIAVAPWAHVSGTAIGALLAALLLRRPRR